MKARSHRFFYYFILTALAIQSCGTAFDSSGSGASSDATAPADVTGLTATPGDGQAILVWTEPADADFDHVEITSNPATSTYRAAAGATTLTATGLTNGVSYAFTVATVDTSGNKSTGATIFATPLAAGGGASDEKEITAFGFTTAVNPALGDDAIGVIDGTVISVSLPFGTAVASLVAVFTTTGASVSVDGVVQVSGATANDFSSESIYVVRAADGSTQDYTVVVTVEADEPEPFNLTAIALNFGVYGTLTGTSSLKVMNSTGTITLSSMTLDNSAFVTGWNTFDIPDISLVEGVKYRVYLERDSGYISGTDIYYWRAACSDVYSFGDNYDYDMEGAPSDFMFITYMNDEVDQYSDTYERSRAIPQTGSAKVWQEFTAGASLPAMSVDSPSSGSSVNLSSVSLYLSVGSVTEPSGTVTLSIGDKNGDMISTLTVDADSLYSGGSWRDFDIPDVMVTTGETYVIYLARSDLASGSIVWRSSYLASSEDNYPEGESSLSIVSLIDSSNGDFMFRTYVDGALDQSCEVNEHGYSLTVPATGTRFQEFVPGA